MAGAPKKLGDNTVTFSYRTNAESWRLFTALATLKGETPTDIFRAREKCYIEENGDLLRAAMQEIEKIGKTDDWTDPIETGKLNAETPEAIRELEEGGGVQFETAEALYKDLGI